MKILILNVIALVILLVLLLFFIQKGSQKEDTGSIEKLAEQALMEENIKELYTEATKEKPYFWQQDRARHFAFRRPDMTFLIYDEQLLDIEGYLEKLKNYTEYFKSICAN